MTAHTLSARAERAAREMAEELDQAQRDTERYLAYLRTVDWHAIGQMIAGIADGRIRRNGRVEGRTAMPYRKKAPRWDGWVDERRGR